MVKIKILTNQNIPNVTRLYRRIFDPILKGLDGKVHQSIWNDRLNDNGLLLGAYVHCTLVGFVLFFEKEKGTNSVHCWIAGVEETYRKKGVLKSLMRVATKKLKDRGYGAITVTVVNEKSPAMYAYLEKYGFSKSKEEPKDWYGEKTTKSFWKKAL